MLTSGAGKTYTMTGKASEEEQGLIPRALAKVTLSRVIAHCDRSHVLCQVSLAATFSWLSDFVTGQILDCQQRLKWQDWTYSLELSVMEVYNDRIRDLLDNRSREVSDINAIKHEDAGVSTVIDTASNCFDIKSA
jgi:hypothetical protein